MVITVAVVVSLTPFVSIFINVLSISPRSMTPKGGTAAGLEVELSVSLVGAETEIGVDVVEGRMGVTRKEELADADPMGGKFLYLGQDSMRYPLVHPNNLINVWEEHKQMC